MSLCPNCSGPLIGSPGVPRLWYSSVITRVKLHDWWEPRVEIITLESGEAWDPGHQCG
jgi:hypothetical protein